MASDKSCAPVSMAFFSSNLGTDVTFPNPMTLIRTLTSYQWKNWATGMQKYSLNIFDFLALPAMELAIGLEICLIRTSPSLAAGKAPTAMLEPPLRALVLNPACQRPLIP